MYSPFDQLYHNEVVPIAAVIQDEAIRGGSFELEEEVHGVIGRQRAEGHVTGTGLKGDGVCNDVLKANHGIEFTVIDVSIFTEVYVGHAIEGEALNVANEVGRHHVYEAFFRHNACLNVVELQLSVIACHLTFD